MRIWQWLSIAAVLYRVIYADAARSDVRMWSQVSLTSADGSRQAGHAFPFSEPSRKQHLPLMAFQLA
jgi:hypothetical protein